jgi:type II secretory pathway component PulJ
MILQVLLIAYRMLEAIASKITHAKTFQKLSIKLNRVEKFMEA